MRILQVVTLLSPDGAYGGPTRVALNQGAELRARGHEVTIVGATRGYRVVPTELNGVPVKLFAARTFVPGTRFAGLGAPGLSRWFHSNRSRFDIVHLHFSRDLIMVRMALAARRHRIPYVLQTHGMVVPSSHPLATPLDAMWTRKLLRDAGAIFYLNPQERDQLIAVGGGQLRLRALGNGVPDYPAAHPLPGPPEVLFAARMHPCKRPIAFVEMAKSLLDAGIDARFTLIGPDAGEGYALRAALDGETRISWEGALPPTALPQRMAAASVYVLPSARDAYPMTVLEAMSVGVPVVVSDAVGLAQLVSRARCGVVVDHRVSTLAAGVKSILADRSLAQAMGKRGRDAVHAEYGMRAVGERLLDTYAHLTGGI